ncbi:glycosyltransferase family 2 protein [Actinomyces glycerinitolerans]|uniref:Nucleotide-diphospho-sugar transferases n=1 Tax=Actinomyces glycerinitolerans TaxID=1892869 RepID=A0A1M4RVQ0_9ACTO|nr:glycosyltransferase family 2 protein [Actinomyces glycerinitolerans]SHE24001.1 nucleotide-diphospho-sugar transferases [Actinomyces glycerinitolerans]
MSAVAGVWAVVVSYHPGQELRGLLESLTEQCEGVVVVDNGSDADELSGSSGIRSLCHAVGAVLVEQGANTGVATAQNRGISVVRARGARFVVLFDDDSAPSDGMIAKLREALAQGDHGRVAAVGPLIRENKPGGDQLVYVARRWGPRRATVDELRSPRLSAAFLLASGCLIDLDVLAEVGGMNEAMFIDHVDLEWGLRARKAGYALLVATGTVMNHSLGDETVQLPGRAQPVHVHGPIRGYYLMRNTIALIRSGLMPVAWRVGYLVWMLKYIAFNALIADRRRERLRAMSRGIVDGLRDRGGPAPF